MSRDSSQPQIGVLFAVIAVALFATYDTGSKLASASASLVFVLWVRYLIQMIWLGITHRKMAANRVWQTDKPVAHTVRALLLLVCNVFSFLSFKYLPVAEVTSIVMLMPILMTIFAARMLRERVGAAKWALLALGMAGVLMVVRPGLRAWDLTMLLPLAFLLTYTGFQATTSKLVKTEMADSVFFYTSVVGFLSLSAIQPFTWAGLPSLHMCVLVACVAAASSIGHQLLVLAYAKAPASAITPFLYFQLVFAAVGGWLVFGERPDTLAIVGGLMIMASGVASALVKPPRAE